jgi:hypothetical protein
MKKISENMEVAIEEYLATKPYAKADEEIKEEEKE